MLCAIDIGEMFERAFFMWKSPQSSPTPKNMRHARTHKSEPANKQTNKQTDKMYDRCYAQSIWRDARTGLFHVEVAAVQSPAFDAKRPEEHATAASKHTTPGRRSYGCLRISIGKRLKHRSINLTRRKQKSSNNDEQTQNHL